VKIENMTLPQKLTQRITIAMLTAVFSVCPNTDLILAQPIDLPTLYETRKKSHLIALSKQASKKIKTRNKFRIIYSDTRSKDPFTNTFVEYARRRKLLEFIALEIDNFRLSRPISLIMKDCGVPDVFYSSNGSITLCNEYATYVEQTFTKAGYNKKKAGIYTEETIVFSLFHEMGHLLIRELNLISAGKPEDVADQFSVFAFLSSRNKSFKVSSRRQNIVLSASAFFVHRKDDLKNSRTFTDSHSLNMQRAYYLICHLYVKDPDHYANFVSALGYDSRSLRSCRRDTEDAYRAWYRLLEPHFIR
jgi:Putative metallopeptidase